MINADAKLNRSEVFAMPCKTPIWLLSSHCSLNDKPYAGKAVDQKNRQARDTSFFVSTISSNVRSAARR